jgi:hypothetical protein
MLLVAVETTTAAAAVPAPPLCLGEGRSPLNISTSACKVKGPLFMLVVADRTKDPLLRMGGVKVVVSKMLSRLFYFHAAKHHRQQYGH